MTKTRVKMICLGSMAAILIAGSLLYCNASKGEAKENPSEAWSPSYQQGWKIAMAARTYIRNEALRYDASYVAGGYPEINKGVCTDVVWAAFFDIGVSIKYLVDKDIRMNPGAYKKVITVPDPNIDFRRVSVLEVFFERNAQSLTTDLNDILAWMPGDIVTFESSHIAVVSSLRNVWGRPYIIQHGKDPAAEEDRIWASDGMKISGHYRWQ